MRIIFNEKHAAKLWFIKRNENWRPTNDNDDDNSNYEKKKFRNIIRCKANLHQSNQWNFIHSKKNYPKQMCWNIFNLQSHSANVIRQRKSFHLNTKCDSYFLFFFFLLSSSFFTYKFINELYSHAIARATRSILIGWRTEEDIWRIFSSF